MAKTKPKTRLAYLMSDQCRRPKERTAAFLKWINGNPEFKRRKPTINEVLKEARKAKSPLRILIEQDVKQAAQQQWRAEIQYYLRHVQVVRIDVVTNEVLTKPVCAYIPVKFSSGGRINDADYVPAQRVADNPSFKRSVLDRIHADFLAWFHRWERYEEFMEAFSPVIAAYKQIEARFSQEAA